MLDILLIIILAIFLQSLLIDSKEKSKKYNIDKSIKINEKLFMNKRETADYLSADEDNFVNNLDIINKKARGETNIYNYLDKIVEAATDFKIEDKYLLQKAMNDSEKLILGTSSKKLLEYGINKERLKMLRGIRLALTSGKIYENGYPHTRGNVIFLSTDYLDNYRDNPKKVLRTIIHEIVHIYQRNNGRIYDGFLKQEFWTIVLKPKEIERRRMNPDLDLDIWERNGRVYMAKFTSSNPSSLDEIDIKGESQYEHPYEYYAYKFSNELTKEL